MMVSRALLFLFVVRGTCLKINMPSQVTQKLASISESCQQASLQDDLGDIVATVGFFFPSQNITVYPAVLTMVAAMRYGGISAVVNETRHLVDHDMDFMLVPKGNRFVGMKFLDALMDKWRSHVESKLNVKTECPSLLQLVQNADDLQWLMRFIDSEYFGRSVNGNFINTIIQVRRHTAVTDKFMQDGIFTEGRGYQKRWWSAQGSNSTIMPDSMMTKLLDTTDEVIGGTSTIVNFWASVTPDSRFLPSKTKQVLFMGHIFAFPEQRSSILGPLLDEFGDFHTASGKKLCDFALPNGLYEEDMPPSRESSDITTACIQDLHTLGFESFHDCL
jgi:hypothetical protein